MGKSAKWTAMVVAWLDRCAGYMNNIGLWISVVSMLALTFLVFANAVGRKLFNIHIVGSMEISCYMFVALTLLSLGYALRTGYHIRISFAFDRMPQKAKPWVQVASDVIAVIFFLIMVLTSANVVVVSFRLHSISSTELGVIQWPLQLIVPIGFGLLLLESLVTLSKNLTASSRKVSNDPN